MATAFFNTPEKSVVNLFHDPPGSCPGERVLEHKLSGAGLVQGDQIVPWG